METMLETMLDLETMFGNHVRNGNHVGLGNQDLETMLDFAQSRTWKPCWTLLSQGPFHLRQNQLIDAIGTRRNGYWKVAIIRTPRFSGAPLPSSRGAEKTAEILA
ncbi:MAG: hypothetical protein A2284_13345 [Deltaproteobacteria bacterium RIFOXYA12_FULL_61_11]|nr:MAG: hypothetical protein A2284_13345 [Deltaproteobacteria bacterium RIFOXYA12_FULL_61_11]